MQPTMAPAMTDQEALARARYFAHAQRRTMPPRCNPIGIVIIVLSIGMVFIGLTMTIIANWPGATSIGENPLKIAGPVLLAVGGVVFFIGVALICILNGRERRKWEDSITNIIKTKSSPNSSAHAGLVANDYGAYDPMLSNGNNRSSSGGKSGGPYRSSTGEDTDSNVPVKPYTDSIAEVPDPVRIQKKRAPSKGVDSSSESANVSREGAVDMNYDPPEYPGRGKSGRGGGQDRSGSGKNRYPYDVDAEGGGAGGGGRGKGGKGGRGDGYGDDGTGGRDDGYGGGPGGKGDGYGDGGQGGRKGGSGKQKNGGSGDKDRSGKGGKGGGDGDGSGREEQRLKVHIIAQPGTAVLITPSATPPRGSPPNTPVRWTSSTRAAASSGSRDGTPSQKRAAGDVKAARKRHDSSASAETEI